MEQTTDNLETGEEVSCPGAGRLGLPAQPDLACCACPSPYSPLVLPPPCIVCALPRPNLTPYTLCNLQPSCMPQLIYCALCLPACLCPIPTDPCLPLLNWMEQPYLITFPDLDYLLRPQTCLPPSCEPLTCQLHIYYQTTLYY